MKMTIMCKQQRQVGFFLIINVGLLISVSGITIIYHFSIHYVHHPAMVNSENLCESCSISNQALGGC